MTTSYHYPTEIPKNKHDLVCPKLPPIHEELSSIKDLNFSSTPTDELFDKLENGTILSKHKDKLRKLSHIYTYKDGQNVVSKGPLSRALYINGYVSNNQSSSSSSTQLLTKLAHILTKDNNGSSPSNSGLHKCTISVKLADNAKHVSQLKKEDTFNSYAFASFMKRLRKECLVAIVGCDKYKRFGFLCPMVGGSSSIDDNEYEANDFVAYFYIGNINQVKEYTLSLQQQQPEDPSPAYMPETPTYLPESPSSPPPAAAAAAPTTDGNAGVWETHHDDDGNAYYYNTETEVTQWEKPDELIAVEDAEQNITNEDGENENNTQRIEEPQDTATKESITDGNNDNGNNSDVGDSPRWKPPSDDEGDDGNINSGGDNEQQPPSNGLWQPPPDDDDGDDKANTFGAAADSPKWEPSTPPMDSQKDKNNDSPAWEPSTPPIDGDQVDNNNNSPAWEPSTPPIDDQAEEDNNDWTNNNRKRKRSSSDDSENGDVHHSNEGAAAADKFYSGLTRSLDTRADSKLYHMRAFNGWVKATQIAELDPRTKGGSGGSLRILDLACGKGGDLGKWILHNRGIQNYVGIDVARGSLVDAAKRVRSMKGKKSLSKCTFTCADLGYDVPGRKRSSKNKTMQKLLSWSLQTDNSLDEEPKFTMVRGGGVNPEQKFDIVSIQFAIHYMMQTRSRARRFFNTVSELLEVGGNLIATTIDARVVVEKLLNLGINWHNEENNSNNKKKDVVVVKTGNSACQLNFDYDIAKKVIIDSSSSCENKSGSSELGDNLFGLQYTFTLVEGEDHSAGVGDAVNLPEWLIPIPVLKALANEAGLDLVYAQNFHEFYSNRSNPNEHGSAHNALYNMHVLNRNGSISQDEWDISRMYVAIKFVKTRDVSNDDLDDGGDDSDNDGENNDNENDNTNCSDAEANEASSSSKGDTAARSGLFPIAIMKAKKNAQWASLSSDEKKQLIEFELQKLM